MGPLFSGFWQTGPAPPPSTPAQKLSQVLTAVAPGQGTRLNKAQVHRGQSDSSRMAWGQRRGQEKLSTEKRSRT